MMNNLIVPMAGKSSRYEGLRPKWMMTHPRSGRFMAIESIMGINLDFFDSITFVCLEEHESNYRFHAGFKKELEDNGLKKADVLMLKKPTLSQPETVSIAIEGLGLEGFVFIKDSDNFYEIKIDSTENQIAYFDLNTSKRIDASSKSYLQMDSNGIVTNILEKRVISPFFSVGGYGFKDADEFIGTFRRISEMNYGEEIYTSHVIFDMILQGNIFFGKPVSDYKDWGTYDEWKQYLKTYCCLFVDIDGVLLSNTSLHFSNLGSGRPIQKNIDLLARLKRSGRATIILTTSRKEDYRKMTEDELNRHGIQYDSLLMNLPHCQRIIVNDFAPSNPFPSCMSINIERDVGEIGKFFQGEQR